MQITRTIEISADLVRLGQRCDHTIKKLKRARNYALTDDEELDDFRRRSHHIQDSGRSARCEAKEHEIQAESKL